MDPIVVITIIFLVALVVGCTCVKKMRMACCWTRLDLLPGEDKVIVNILKAANKSDGRKKKKNTNRKENIDVIQRRESVAFNKDITDPNIELKVNIVKGKQKRYIQKKWKTMKDK